jgi:hypothetical protein
MAEAKELSSAEIVARKSQDVEEPSSDRHVKVFVLSGGFKPTEGNGYSHEANKAATRQYMMSQGLRPTGDVSVDSIKEQSRNGKTVGWEVTYSVGAIPAGDYDPQTAPVYVVAPGEKAETSTGKAPKPSSKSSKTE